jgi:hypothetical protein
MALRVLSGIAAQPKSPASARVHAAAILLERGWGKPEQGHTIAGRDGGDIKVVIRQIVESVGQNPVEPEPDKE